MNFLYPENKIFTVLMFFVLASAPAYSQTSSYAAVRKSETSSAIPARLSASVISIKARNANSIELNWQPFKGAVSHYVLERSFDGRWYDEAGVLFTGEWMEEPAYYFTDKLKKAYGGIIYYRLRVVGLDGSEVYTIPTVAAAQ